jgi:hypothetical protein
MDPSKINLLTSASLNDGLYFSEKEMNIQPGSFTLKVAAYKLPVSSLSNQSMECVIDTNTSEYTSMLSNRRDGPLAQELANKLSIVANTNSLM